MARGAYGFAIEVSLSSIEFRGELGIGSSIFLESFLRNSHGPL
jgi:hypothetical protein